MNATPKIEDLLAIVGRLSEVLEQENQALRDQRHREAAALLEEKSRLAQAYESQIKGLREVPAEDLAEVDAELRDQLREAGERVQRQMEENAILLKAAIEAGRRFMEAVADAVRDKSTTSSTYTARGGLRNPKGRGGGASKTLAVSLNQAL